ncbi:polysaccharide biosynthesis tyrosine autokinase [Clostridium bowmanii]|uniref:polysaccharide biosynthesis tyrosine autokinase n=1 Tax=Clostridium bowmanii TaxID=132925 RepID=UPI001C0C01A8|nr:polysaccharide biosynthesis tyrosine autokinase [Clostridium bowmanii]MBU3191202.1 polysaccharide biosynthesis tyrosine autokinase [Clostridium bowmanii]MCA1075650.1 polysaccharide biosynthesis tyrosine autokinase [Clostridium bowmanii]
MREEEDIDFKDYLNIIRKRIFLLLFIIICPMIIAGLLSFYVMKPVYEANSTVIVGKDNADKITQSEVLMYQDLIKTYSEIGKSRIVAENAIENLKLDIAVKDFMLNLSITPKIGTQIIEISYKSGTPETAAEGADALSQAFIQESQKLLPSGSAKIMDKALVPEFEIAPKKKFNIAIGFIIGIMLSFGLVLLINYLNNTIKNEDDIQRYLDLPTIGLIPKQNKMENLIVEKDPKSLATEAFKSMRTNLLFSMENRRVKTIVICSSGPKEGKTSISTNIASVIAKTGKSILLVDCDLRKPCVHRQLNITNNELGLVDVVLEGRKVEEVLIKIEENFDVITAGKANYSPSELLASQKMKVFIEDMEKKYDYVMIDTPPIITFTDALTLVTEKVGVILVISAEETTIENCKKSKQLLLNINAMIIGIVLNKVDKKSFIGYGYDYYSNGKERKSTLNNKGGRKKRNNKEKSDSVNI